MINVLDVKSPSPSCTSTFSTSKLFPLDSSNSHGQYLFLNDPSLGVKKTQPKEWKAKELPDHWLEFAKHVQRWNKLSKRDKRTIQLFWPHRHCELSYEEISAELDIPLGTVKAQLFRAREFLSNLLRHRKDSI